MKPKSKKQILKEQLPTVVIGAKGQVDLKTTALETYRDIQKHCEDTYRRDPELERCSCERKEVAATPEYKKGYTSLHKHLNKIQDESCRTDFSKEQKEHDKEMNKYFEEKEEKKMKILSKEEFNLLSGSDQVKLAGLLEINNKDIQAYRKKRNLDNDYDAIFFLAADDIYDKSTTKLTKELAKNALNSVGIIIKPILGHMRNIRLSNLYELYLKKINKPEEKKMKKSNESFYIIKLEESTVKKFKPSIYKRLKSLFKFDGKLWKGKITPKSKDLVTLFNENGIKNIHAIKIKKTSKKNPVKHSKPLTKKETKIQKVSPAKTPLSGMECNQINSNFDFLNKRLDTITSTLSGQIQQANEFLTNPKARKNYKKQVDSQEIF